MTDEQLDALTAKLFATEDGKALLIHMRGRSSAWATVCKEIDRRVGRMRVRWGDRS